MMEDVELEVRQRLVGGYELDETDERFMERLNDALAPFEEEGYGALAEEAMPNLFVVGAPRSGTTLLVQLLASHLELGWISNLAAGFWRAPCTGIRLHRRLLGDELASSFQSRAGRTLEIAEPHEFGYLWTRLLGHGLAEPEPDHEVDWARARRTLLHMDQAWGRPIVFKAFQLVFHVRETVSALPRSLFLHLRRDHVDTALSILRTRVVLTGTDETWISLRPRGSEAVRDRPPAEQVAWQVLRVEQLLSTQFEALSDANVVAIDFDDLIERPGEVLEHVSQAMALGGYPSRLRRAPDVRFKVAQVHDRPGDRGEVEAAIERWRGGDLEAGELRV